MANHFDAVPQQSTTTDKEWKKADYAVNIDLPVAEGLPQKFLRAWLRKDDPADQVIINLIEGFIEADDQASIEQVIRQMLDQCIITAKSTQPKPKATWDPSSIKLPK